jgi:hypothetical protein
MYYGFLTRKYIHKLRSLFHYLFRNILPTVQVAVRRVIANIDLGTIRKEAAVICVTVLPQYGCIHKLRCICKITTLRSLFMRIWIMRTGIVRYNNINKFLFYVQSLKYFESQKIGKNDMCFKTCIELCEVVRKACSQLRIKCDCSVFIETRIWSWFWNTSRIEKKQHNFEQWRVTQPVCNSK